MNRSERKERREREKAEQKTARAAHIASMSPQQQNTAIIGCAGVIVLAIVAVLGLSSGGEEAQPEPAAGPTATTLPGECPATSKPRDVIVVRDALVLTAPRNGAPPLTHTVGTATAPATVDGSVAVRQLCTNGGWSLIRVLGPQELRKWQGWVPAPSLGAVPVTGSGRRIYRASDFNWPTGSRHEQAGLLKVINRIMEERSDCEAVDTRSLVVNGTGTNRVYSILCFGPNDETSFDFTAADTTSGRSFAPVAPISKADAIEACKQAILSRASHPSTVEFPTFDYDQRDGGNGNTQLLMSFKAKNAFNLELEHDAQCDFHGQQVIRVTASEAAP